MSLTTIFEAQKSAYKRNPYADATLRKYRLNRLDEMLQKYEQPFADAIAKDFGTRTIDETRFLDVFTSFAGIRHARKKVKSWMKPQRRPVSLLFQPAKARILYQPLGVVGIVVPWNYPLYLALGPMVCAMAAGNHVMVKMSESTPLFGQCFQQACQEFFNEDEVCIVNGGIDVAVEFTQLDFDHLLYTGSTAVGKKVMAAAAENLTPVTLELGGKSPTIVDTQCDLVKAVQRIVIGKLVNAGQTCVAPDYVLLPESLLEPFIEQAKIAAEHYYPDWKNQDYTSIINDKEYQRQLQMVDELKGGFRIEPLLSGDDIDHARKVCPRIVVNPDSHCISVQQEIFGPLLPVITYRHISEAINYVNQGERPLALYVFSQNKNTIKQILTQTHSGGVAVNDCLLHVAQEELPFGGIGPSGMGHYHGKEGFVTFSKAKSIFYQSRINGASLLTPPYKGFTRKLLALLTRIA